MRWPHESAITRRDEHLARTRRLSIWIAGGASAASFGLAAALGFALPGHSVSSGTTSHATTGSGQRSGQGSGQGTSRRTGSARHHHRRLAPPPQAPGNTGAPPAVSSGGS
ncbi:MAG TPA: hypothetical protein VMU94_12415 [Streptosporangiaceae bacterium]|nr:hypothetical protein [Streptosporangiaceae bacterium]